MRKTLIGLILTVTLWAGGTAVLKGEQGFNAQIQAALNALGYVTNTATVVQWSKSFLMAASSYVNFGASSGVNGYGIRDSAGTIQFKNSGGGWTSLPTGGQAPAVSRYLVQIADASLPNAQVMGSLASGFVLNTTITGVQSVWTGGGCNNSFISNIASNGTLTCNSQPGTAGVNDWGASGFGWKNIYFTGASGTPGTNQFELTGTSTGGTRVITFPDASITVQSTTGTPAGFVIASQATGDSLYASSASAWARRAIGSTGQVSVVAGGLPTWGFVGVLGYSPAVIQTTDFETATRFTVANTSAGTSTFGTSGLLLNTSATISSASTTTETMGRLVDFTKPTLFTSSFVVTPVGTDVQFYIGLSLPTTAGAGITFTDSHAGFKMIRAASGTMSLYATQADGVTETASAALATVANLDEVAVCLRATSTGITYYYSVNGAAWSAGTTLVNNPPTTWQKFGFAITNAGVATATSVYVFSASVQR